ncbi:hypothetical protein BABINDRAFT_161421 [Babjeviella inositovora NRRL Y-12698]|uniref:Uncharacterized protein n=1 Tax=Babjeviella inositovora NRRL Y-12698 TaxID=984486 RepID=A0A1E3QPY9_9ASCO|nr:uncharacterized protein BABINDRAFT_161421 [Babjeviella inositovora NRRL Y-12698]ODQ79708.1 hypothetical protein BABINDRAFT_161421 [Babjeviella inositovora NRRL Y-12698]
MARPFMFEIGHFSHQAHKLRPSFHVIPLHNPLISSTPNWNPERFSHVSHICGN